MVTITLNCLSCRKEVRQSLEELGDKLADDITLENLNQYILKFCCQSCGSKSFSASTTSGLPLFNSNDYKPCKFCKNPVWEKRLETFPDADTCLYCANNVRESRTEPPYPTLPEKTLCPRCESPLFIQQGHESKEYFIACTAFPKCRYTKPYEHAPKE